MNTHTTFSYHGKIVAISAVLAIAILIFDLSLPLGVAGGVPYVALVLVGLWSPWRYYTYLMALVATGLTIVGYYSSPEGGTPWVVLTNRALALFAIWVTAVLGARVRSSEINLRGLVDTAASGIVTINTRGIIESFNKAAEAMFGYSAREVTGENVSMLMPSPYREEHDQHIIRYLKTGVPRAIGVSRELIGRKKDGTVFPMTLSLSEVQHGARRSFTGILSDLTKQKTAEEQLRKLSRAVEQSPASIVITDRQGVIEYVNPKFTQVTGYTAEEVVGQNPRVLRSGEMPPEGYKRLWDTIIAGGEWRGEFHNRKKNGELFWESASISPVKDPSGTITHFLAVKEDITERKRMEEVTARLIKILDASLNEIYVFETDTLQLTDANRGAQENLGFTIEELRRFTLFDMLTEFSADSVRELLAPLQRGERKSIQLSATQKRKDGSQYPIELHLQHSAFGSSSVYLAIALDVSERMEKEEELIHALNIEALGELTGGVAHDFNNLLTIILGNLTWLSRRYAKKLTTETREIIDDALSAARDGTELTQRLLAFSRKQTLQPRPLMVNAFVSDFGSFLSRTLGMNVDLRIETGKDVRGALVDPSQLESALLNLAVNARDAMRSRGILTIKTAKKGVTHDRATQYQDLAPGIYVSLTVSDTGIGMSPEVVMRACEPYFTTKQPGAGSGLGLSMVYGFAKQSGGGLHIESAQDKGTSVTLYLPEATIEHEEDKVERVYDELPRGNETVLVTEDTPLVRRFVVRTLNSLGYRVLEAENAEQAMKILETDDSVEMLFADVVMPGEMNGHELARWAAEKRPGLIVALTTGFSGNFATEYPVDDDQFSFLKKPFTEHELAQTIRSALDRH